jgi:hypothetical protein
VKTLSPPVYLAVPPVGSTWLGPYNIEAFVQIEENEIGWTVHSTAQAAFP